jgi:glycine oxidase
MAAAINRSLDMADLAVVGAGPMGLVTALMAARSGIKVAIYDRADDFSASSGWKATGMLSPECSAEAAVDTLVDLGRRSVELWPTLIDGVTVTGTIVVAGRRQPGLLDKFAEKTAGHRELDADALVDLEPALHGHYSRALYYSGEGYLDPRLAFSRLKSALDALNVRFHFGWVGVVDRLPAERIVDSRGLGARDRFPLLRGVRAEMALVRTHEISLTRPIRLINQRHAIYVLPRSGGVFAIGSTTSETDRGEMVTLKSAGELLTHAFTLHPGFAEAEVLEFRAGLLPSLPDDNPQIAVGERVIAVNGLSRHGWTVAPAIAEDLVRVIYTQSTKVIHSRPASR